jgi:hypothetical protein
MINLIICSSVCIDAALICSEVAPSGIFGLNTGFSQIVPSVKTTLSTPASRSDISLPVGSTALMASPFASR